MLLCGHSTAELSPVIYFATMLSLQWDSSPHEMILYETIQRQTPHRKFMPNAKSHCSRLCKIPTHAQATHPNNLTPAAGPVCLTRRMLRPASINQTLPTTSQGWAPRL